MTWYHGGPSGLKGFILPPTESGADGTRDVLGRHEPTMDTTHVRRDRVFLIDRFEGALLFACPWPHPAVYEVEPVGEIEPDPDFRGDGITTRSVQAPRARIIRELHVSAAQAREAIGAVVGRMPRWQPRERILRRLNPARR